MIEISEQKSGRELTTRILLSLNYFTSAENAEMINNQVISLENTTWNTVKSEISNVLVEYNKKLFLGDSDEN
ncbi:MAG: hypothetical protein JKY53_01390 [Flavobacteriales bacterium]|nr:hypothetical protein [Flavobacteriales bacterium]